MPGASLDPRGRKALTGVRCDVVLNTIVYTKAISRLPVQFSFDHNWMRAGAVGLGAFTLAAILSVRPVRHVAFEFFLITHIVLVACVRSAYQIVILQR